MGTHITHCRASRLLVGLAVAVFCLTIAGAGVADWVSVPAAAAVEAEGPEILSLTSPSHPDEGAWYTSRSVDFAWEGAPVISHLGDVACATPLDIVVRDDLAFVGTDQWGLHIFDLRDPARPTYVGGYNPDLEPGSTDIRYCVASIALAGDIAYCATFTYLSSSHPDSLLILDVSDPSAPSLLAEMAEPPGWGGGPICLNGNYLYCCESSPEGSLFTVLDVTDRTNPVQVGQCGLASVPYYAGHVGYGRIEVRGSYAYIGGSSLQVVNVQNPATPEFLGSLERSCIGPAISGDYLFGGEWAPSSERLNVFSLGNPANPVFLGQIWSYHELTSCADVAVTDDDAGLARHYLLGGYDAAGSVDFVELYDISGPLYLGQESYLLRVGDLHTGGGQSIQRVVVDRGLVLVAERNVGVAIDHLGPMGYSYSLDQNPAGAPDTIADGTVGGLATKITITAPSDGVWYFHVRGVDSQGNWGPTATRRVQIGTGPIDEFPPVTTASGYDDAWHASPVTVSFSATDPGPNASGVAYTEWRLDAGSWTRGTSCTVPAPANTQHVYILGYRSADNVGNLEVEKTCQVKIDTTVPPDLTPPVMSFSCPDDLAKWHNHDLAVTFAVTDAGSGPDAVLYAYDDSSAWYELDLGESHTLDFPAEADHSWDGETTVHCKARDLADNVSAEQSFTVKIDTRRPTAKALYAVSVTKGRAATLKYRVNDLAPNGGTASAVTIKVKNRSGKTVKTFRLGTRQVNKTYSLRFTCKLARGSYRWYVSGKDVAGNTAKVGSNRLTVK